MVIDTTIFIEHLRKSNRSNSLLSQLPLATPLYVSVITVYELWAGATDVSKERDVSLILSAVNILPVNENVAKLAARIFLQVGRGNIIGTADTLIAATATYHNLPIKTLNTKHFSRVAGLIIV